MNKQLIELIQFYQTNKKLPTIEENKELADFFQKIVTKEISFPYTDPNFSLFHDFQIDVLLDELYQIVKVRHHLPKNEEKSKFNTFLKGFYHNAIGDKLVKLNESQKEKLALIYHYVHYDEMMQNDIITYYETYHQLPPVGTINEIGEDIGKYIYDIENSNSNAARHKRKNLRKKNIPIASNAQIKRSQKIDDLLEKKDSVTSTSDYQLYSLRYRIEHGKLTILERNHEKLKAHGIIPNSKQSVFPFQKRDRKITEQEQTKLLEDAYAYLISHPKEFEIPSQDKVRLIKMLELKYQLTEQQLTLVHHILLLQYQRKFSQEMKPNSEQETDIKIERFCAYIIENNQFPWHDTELISFIQTLCKSVRKLTVAQVKKLSQFIPFDGGSLKEAEKAFFIRKIVEIFESNQISSNHVTHGEKLLPPCIYSFLQNVINGRTKILLEQAEQLRNIGIPTEKIKYHQKSTNGVTVSAILLHDAKKMERQLQMLSQKLDFLLTAKKHFYNHQKKEEKRKRKTL